LEFHQRLASERKRLGMTQREFAESCGVRPATQFLYEKGDRSPSATYLSRALECGADLTALFYGDDQIQAGTSLPLEEITRLYVQCDQICRDKDGRLLDLEERTAVFRDLYIEKALELEKLAS
jgi:transcriptional regulator with XRE-family HTH domain